MADYTAKAEAEHYEEVRFLHGENHFQTDNFGQITWRKLLVAATSPSNVPKAEAAIFAPHNGDGRDNNTVEAHNQYWAAILDLDNRKELLDQVVEKIKGLGLEEFVVFTSSSHGLPDMGNRYKVVIPFSQQADLHTWCAIQGYLASEFSSDTSQARPAQLCYMPNMSPGGYDHHINAGDFLDLESDPLVIKALQWFEAEEAKAAKKATTVKPAERKPIDGPDGHISPVDAWCQAHSVEGLLGEYGYRSVGKRWLHPDSKSGMPGVIVTDAGRYVSYHGCDPLSDGHSHDAFDLYVHHRHNGDLKAALIGAAQTLMTSERITVEEHNREAWKRQQASKAHEGTGEGISIDDAPDVSVAPEDAEEWPHHLSHPPGMLGAIVDHLMDTALRGVRVHSVATAIQAVSIATANKYAMANLGTRANAYFLNIGPTGCGKQHQFDKLTEMATASSMSHALQSTFASGPAIHSFLSENDANQPIALMMQDEIGHLLAVSEERGAVHHKTIVELLLKVYGLAGGTLLSKPYADSSKTYDAVPNPFFGLLGASTPEKFMGALKVDQVYDGLLNRMLVFRTDIVPPINRHANRTAPIPDAIAKQLSAIRRDSLGTAASPRYIPFASPADEDFAFELSDYFDDRRNKGGRFGPLWARSWENTLKIAMLMALADTLGQPQDAAVDITQLKWARDLVTQTTRGMAGAMEEEHTESRIDEHRKKALRYIKYAKKYTNAEYSELMNKGYMPQRRLQQLMKALKARDFGDLVQDMLMRGDVVAEDMTTRAGKSSVCLRIRS